MNWIQAALKVSAAILRTKVIEGAQDEVAVVFFNAVSLLYAKMKFERKQDVYVSYLSS